MTDNALTIATPSIPIQDLGNILFQSGYFQDAKSAAQAIVKVLAGQELGIGPIASMTGINIVQGKPTLGANLIASQIKRSGRYDYRIIRLDDTACELAFFEQGKEIGRSGFTTQDAERAGLLQKPTWRSYPRNMLFSRAVSNGARWYTPDVFGGSVVYTPEELEGEYVDARIAPPAVPASEPKPEQQAEPEPKPAPATAGRPYTPEQVRERIHSNVDSETRPAWRTGIISTEQKQLLAILLRDAVSDDGDSNNTIDDKRHCVMQYLVGKASSSELTMTEAGAMIGWLRTDPAMARQEAHLIVRAQMAPPISEQQEA